MFARELERRSGGLMEVWLCWWGGVGCGVFFGRKTRENERRSVVVFYGERVGGKKRDVMEA